MIFILNLKKMDEKNFDNKLKDILGNPPSFEMLPADLEDMKRRLEEDRSPPSRGVLWWWLPLLLLPFLLAGFFLFSKYQSLHDQVNTLSLQLSTIQKDSAQTHRLITYQYDTIYNTIYKDVIIERRYEEAAANAYSANASSFPYYHPSTLNLSTLQQRYLNVQSIAWDLGQTGPLLLNSGPNSSFSSIPGIASPFSNQIRSSIYSGIESNHPTANKALITAFSQLSLLDAPLLAEKTRQLPQELLDDILPLSTERSVNPAYYLVPTGLSLEARYAPFVLANTPGRKGATAFGLAAEVKFPGPLRLQLGAELLQTKIYTKDPTAYNNYPILPPNNPVDLLEEVKGTLSYLQIPIGLKMIFRQEKKYRPFISAGIVARRPFRQQFNYEYFSATQGEYKIENTLKDGSFSINNFRSGLGLEYTFLKKFAASTTLYYQHSFGLTVGDYFQLRYWGLNIGLRYRL